MDFLPSLCAYVSPIGQQVRLGTGPTEATSSYPPAPQLRISSTTNGKVTTCSVTVTGDNALLANLDQARWKISPSAVTYSGHDVFGPTATFKHATRPEGHSIVVLYVPRFDGGPEIVVDTKIRYSTTSKSGLFPKSVTYGNETLNIETSFGFAEELKGARVRLIRTASPGNPIESSIVEERAVDFAPGVAQVLSRAIAFPTATGLGAGYDYYWDVQTDTNHIIRCNSLPMWVLGNDPTCAPQNINNAPLALNYPSIFTRKASDSKRVMPASGKTYDDHLATFTREWRADHLGASAPGGAWLSFQDYFSNIYYVDLDDATIPRYRFQQWDQWQWGYILAGWYGVDNYAKPWPRSYVAVDVPVPNNAQPSIGTDRSLCIVGMRAGKIEKIWEMWLAMKNADGSWRAASIGLTDASNDWLHSQSYTVAASGISALAYALRVREAKAAVEYVRAQRAAGAAVDEATIVGLVPHALAINMPNPRASVFSYPATFSDGTSTDVTMPREGQLAYLRQDVDLAAAGLTPLKHVIAAVGKHRGFRVTDRTSWNTSMIVEGDQSYGGGIWSTLREGAESWAVKFPDDWFEIGKNYASRAEFDADTGTT